MDTTQKLTVETVAVGRLFCSPANPRLNDPAVPHVAASIRRFGFRQPIVAKPSGEVIAGNTRLKAAISLGLTEVPVAWFDGSDLDATAYAIADNRTHEFAEWDDQSLAALLETLRAEDALDGVGFSDEEIDQLLAELAAEQPDQESNDPGPEEPPENPVSRLGDLWLLGEHRILCGDSTSADALARLMDGENAQPACHRPALPRRPMGPPVLPRPYSVCRRGVRSGSSRAERARSRTLSNETHRRRGDAERLSEGTRSGPVIPGGISEETKKREEAESFSPRSTFLGGRPA